MLRSEFEYYIDELLDDSEYMQSKDNKAKILYILRSSKELFKGYLVGRKDDWQDLKSGSDARGFIDQGNQSTDLGEEGDSEEIKLYSEAILVAPHGSNELREAFRLRALEFAIIGDLESALFDTQRAQEIEDSQELRDNRDEYINQINPTQEIQAPEIKNEIIIEDIYELLTHPQRGRYMIAKQNIAASDTLLDERCQVITPSRRHRHEYCINCFKFIGSKVYPCHGCADAVFCSQNCLDEGMNRYHNKECGVTAHIYDRLDIHLLMAYRLLTSFQPNFTIANTYESFRNRPEFDITAWIDNHKNKLFDPNDKEERFQEFLAILSFVDHFNHVKPRVMIKDIFDAIELALVLEISEKLEIENDEEMSCFVEMLVTLVRKQLPNNFGWNVFDPNSGKVVSIAICLAIVSTMINHSCRPNMDWSIETGRQTIYAKTDILPGTEISISYGPDESYCFIKRRTHLWKAYYFYCDCKLCIEDEDRCVSLCCLTCGGPVFYTEDMYHYRQLTYDYEQPYDLCLNCQQKYVNATFAAHRVKFYGSLLIIDFRILCSEIAIDLKNIERDRRRMRACFDVLSNYMWKFSNKYKIYENLMSQVFDYSFDANGFKIFQYEN